MQLPIKLNGNNYVNQLHLNGLNSYRRRTIFKILKLVGIFCLLQQLMGCQTSPIKYEQVEKGSWSTRILVRDKRKHKSFIVNVDLKAEADGRLRMDATSSFGQHLASLVIDKKKITYLIVPQRKYYSGKLNKRALKRAIGVSIDPNLLFSMIFDRPPLTKDWTCTREKRGYLTGCKNLKSGVVLEWKNRDAGRKLVTLEHRRATVQMNFSNYNPGYKFTEKTYSLKIPKSFKRIFK